MTVILVTLCGCERTLEVQPSSDRFPLYSTVEVTLKKTTPEAHVAEHTAKPEMHKRVFRWKGATRGYTKRPVFEEVME